MNSVGHFLFVVSVNILLVVRQEGLTLSHGSIFFYSYGFLVVKGKLNWCDLCINSTYISMLGEAGAESNQKHLAKIEEPKLHNIDNIYNKNASFEKYLMKRNYDLTAINPLRRNLHEWILIWRGSQIRSKPSLSWLFFVRDRFSVLVNWFIGYNGVTLIYIRRELGSRSD